MDDMIKNLRVRYDDLNPLMFARSVERSTSAVELFDILEEIPERYALIWDEKTRRWVVTEDILQSGFYEEIEAEYSELNEDENPFDN